MSDRTPAYLGIDPSYTGFAYVLLTDDDYRVRLFDFSTTQAGEGPARLARIYETLHKEFSLMAFEYDVQHVLIEGYANGAKFGREILGELGGVLRLALHYVIGSSRIRTVAPTALKKYTTGTGVASKDIMLLSVFQKWGISLTDNNLADAYAAARLAQALTTGGEHKYEKEVVTSILEGPKKKKPKAA